MTDDIPNPDYNYTLAELNALADEPLESVAGLLRELLEEVRGLRAEQAEAADLTYSVIARCIRGSSLYTGEE